METAATVQQVPKVSSDELLRKFADSGDEGSANKKELRVSMKQRRKRSRKNGEVENCESPKSNCSSNSALVERKSLLIPQATRKSTALLRIGRSKLRARNFKNKSFLGTIEKTWKRTVEGASKVFIEKHYNRHKRLINDAV